MRWVTEYLRCEQACRDLAGKLTKPDDKRALELMAAGWAARAAERKRAIDHQSPNVAGMSGRGVDLFVRALPAKLTPSPALAPRHPSEATTGRARQQPNASPAANAHQREPAHVICHR